jgi:NAD(P)-dependent dehydrogenase (short-subunit alcohol dehydrogenase family)
MPKRRVRSSRETKKDDSSAPRPKNRRATKPRSSPTIFPGRFDGKIALVVGGAQGIGKAIALRLAAEGGVVIVADVDREQLRATIHEIKTNQGKAVGIPCDVRKRKQVERAVADVIKNWNRIDILMYVAGVAKAVSFEETTVEVWDWTMNINLKGAFWFSRAVARQMISQGNGKMVFMASTNAWDAEAKLAPYNASKAGLFLLAKTLARELGRFGICSNAVAPGLIRTRLTEPFLNDPVFMEKYSDLLPLGRVGVPEDIAGAATFLASHDADYITGALLFVDGGQLA